jgi:hypothetical protein
MAQAMNVHMNKWLNKQKENWSPPQKIETD